MSPISLQLRELRADRFTQAELAKRAGVRQATVSDLERKAAAGTLQRVDLDVIERLAKALGVEPGALFVKVPARKRRS